MPWPIKIQEPTCWKTIARDHPFSKCLNQAIEELKEKCQQSLPKSQSSRSNRYPILHYSIRSRPTRSSLYRECGREKMWGSGKLPLCNHSTWRLPGWGMFHKSFLHQISNEMSLLVLSSGVDLAILFECNGSRQGNQRISKGSPRHHLIRWS